MKLLLSLTTAATLTSAIPVQHHLPKGTSECLYASLQMEEIITTSIFITSGEDLKVRSRIQGPMAQRAITSSAEVLAASMRLDKLGTRDKKGLKIDRTEEIDFENLFNDDDVVQDDDWDDDAHLHSLDDELDDIVYQDYYYMDDDDEYEFMEDDAMDDIEITNIRKAKAERENLSDVDKDKRSKEKKDAKKAKMNAARKDRVAEGKHRLEEAKKQREQKKAEKKKELQSMNEGKPKETTYQITEEGWYRFCIDATYATVEIEFDMRASGDLGKPNSKTGHIQTYERHDMLVNEKKLLAKLSSVAKGDNVKEEDLKTTKEQITKMNRLLNEIREKQVNERHRLGIHKAVNEHSHSRMVMGSLFETVFYIVVSGFQVYTIRKWFSGNSILAY